ncbi:hypothetical protein SAMN04489752_3495 [Brevibacterium siliguriense]|uniref:DUF559 domain-containing protein n=1 Tax=Brevibacterium siliguriense TaxID=1136497 RepID=A0A1H1Y0I7_9MICO|nr:endonuclease domain-containing protein [Brevibacterium siliguriense]SDT14679.1 hypothetical protein SAMN04489752_3495 [Brevibacterium siliguriense]
MSIDTRWVMHDFPEVFRSRDYIERGITRHSLYHSKRYKQVLPGVRMDRERFDRRPIPAWADTSWLFDAQRLRAALLHYPDIAAGHALAARLYGWPLPSNWMTSQLHVSIQNPNSRIRLPGITLRRMTNMTVTQWFDLPILAPADVIIGIAGDLLQRDLVKLCDAAVGNWHGPPQIGLDELRDCVRTRPFIRGRKHLSEAVGLARQTVDSPPETDLRLWAVEVGLPEPVVHPQVLSRILGRIVEPDLGYPHARLALEYEGNHHFESKRQRESDLRRDEALRAEGWTVLHVTSNTNYILLEAQIRDHLGFEPRPGHHSRYRR